MLKPIEGTLFLTADLAGLSEMQVRGKVGEAADAGLKLLIPTLAFDHGRSYYPSSLVEPAMSTMFSYRARRAGVPIDLAGDFDRFAVLLDAAAERGMKVMLPTGTLSPEKPGSTMMWPCPATEWFTPQVAQLNRDLIAELASRYAASPAFAGWYLSDEMKWSIDEHELLVGTICAACREQAPDAAILMSPSPAHMHERNQYLLDPASVTKLKADIVCPMDCGNHTHRGPSAFTDAMWSDVQQSIAGVAAACASAGKQCWSNIELFFYDHDREKNVPHNADWSRIERQIAIASAHADRLMCFEFFVLADAPDSIAPLGDSQAMATYQNLREHNRRCASQAERQP